MEQKWKKWTGVVLFLMLVAVAVCYLYVQPTMAHTTYETIKATILKVGKADAIIVESPYQTMVIDCGEEDDGPEVVQFLQNRAIETIDVLIITHFDKDHVGGADQVIEQFDVKRVLVPDYDSTSTEYLDFVVAMQAKGITPERLRETVTFTIGDAEVIVDAPLDYGILEAVKTDETLEVDNDLSLITTIIHGDNRMVFAGDAEKMRLREWLATENAQPCDFLKIPHHGVFNTEMEILSTQLAPTYTAICTSAKNPADAQTVEIFKRNGANVLETKDGDIVVMSNGRLIEVAQAAR
ncbi:MAG: MBL fold metallo-hydrolase [Lachnospiraceae bacterium]|nr:MBL fold metallo-hydrolase [Lachnospiraceae bacterium]